MSTDNRGARSFENTPLAKANNHIAMQMADSAIIEDGHFQDRNETSANVKRPLNVSALKALAYLLKELRSSWIKYHLLWLLIFAIIIGLAWPLPGKALGDVRLNQGLCLYSSNDTGKPRNVCVWSTLSSLCVTLIFFISGLQLKLDKMRKALTAGRSIALGLILILLVTTSTGYAIAAGPKLSPPEFSFGFALFALMPTTLSSCVVIVGYARGDQALALLLTVSTNLLGVAVLPLTVTWMIDVFYQGNSPSTTGAKVNAADLCLSLVFTVLIPLFLGIMLRRIRFVAKGVDSLNFTFKLLSALLLTAIPWMKISQSTSAFGRVSGGSYVVMIITAFSLHVFYLFLCAVGCLLILKRPEQVDYIKCIVIVGAQKTMPVALSVLELLPEVVSGDQGLVVVAIVIFHLIQTMLDSWIALEWAARTKKPSVPVKSDDAAPVDPCEPNVLNENDDFGRVEDLNVGDDQGAEEVVHDSTSSDGTIAKL